MRWSSKQGTKCTRGPPPRHPATTISTNTVWHNAVLLSPSPLKERLERAIKAGARPRVDAEVECDASRHVRFSSSNIARRVMARNTPRECWKRRAARALVEPADAAAANVRRYGEEPNAGGHGDPQNDSPSPLVPSLHGRDSLLQRLLIATLQHSAAPHPEGCLPPAVEGNTEWPELSSNRGREARSALAHRRVGRLIASIS